MLFNKLPNFKSQWLPGSGLSVFIGAPCSTEFSALYLLELLGKDRASPYRVSESRSQPLPQSLVKSKEEESSETTHFFLVLPSCQHTNRVQSQSPTSCSLSTHYSASIHSRGGKLREQNTVQKLVLAEQQHHPNQTITSRVLSLRHETET